MPELLQDSCALMGPVELGVRVFALAPWRCDRCRLAEGARFLDSLWLCRSCFGPYYRNPELECWR